jgi:hypothetical protein
MFLGVEGILAGVQTVEPWRQPTRGLIEAPTISAPIPWNYRVPLPEPDNSTSITNAVNTIVWGSSSGR